MWAVDTLVDPPQASIDTETVFDEVIRQRELWFGQSVRNSDTGKNRESAEFCFPSLWSFVWRFCTVCWPILALLPA